MTETIEVNDHGPRTTNIVDQYKLSAEQAGKLKEIGSDNTEGRISSYSNLHQYISHNFAEQLTKFSKKLPATTDDVRDMGIVEGGEKEFYKVVLDSEIELPEGITLLPGEFIQSRMTDAFVRGTLEIRNQEGKSIGIRLSQCSGSDYPAFFMRENPDSKATVVDWDQDNGPRMNTISDMWIQPQTGRDLSNTETVVIGLMQANNKKRSEAEQSRTESVENSVADIRNKLTL